MECASVLWPLKVNSGLMGASRWVGGTSSERMRVRRFQMCTAPVSDQVATISGLLRRD